MASFTFTAVDLLNLVARILSYAGALGSIGAVLFLRIFDDLLLPAEKTLFRAYALALLSVGFLACFLMLFGAVATLNGAGLAGGFDGEIWALIASTAAGQSVWLRMLGLAILLLGLLFGLLRPGLLLAAAICGSLAVAASFGLTGHARGHDLQVAVQLLLLVHLLGVGFWIGSLWPLLRVAHAEQLPRVADVMTRFGDVAVSVVALLLVMGFCVAWILLEDLTRLLTTDYGWVLLAKMALVFVLLCFAAINNTKLVPAVAAGDTSAGLRLRQSIRLEITLVVMVLAVTGYLTLAFSPP